MNSKILEAIIFYFYLELILDPELIFENRWNSKQIKKENGQNQLWATLILSLSKVFPNTLPFWSFCKESESNNGGLRNWSLTHGYLPCPNLVRSDFEPAPITGQIGFSMCVETGSGSRETCCTCPHELYRLKLFVIVMLTYYNANFLLYKKVSFQ